jgi:hypothetical protein
MLIDFKRFMLRETLEDSPEDFNSLFNSLLHLSNPDLVVCPVDDERRIFLASLKTHIMMSFLHYPKIENSIYEHIKGSIWSNRSLHDTDDIDCLYYLDIFKVLEESVNFHTMEEFINSAMGILETMEGFDGYFNSSVINSKTINEVLIESTIEIYND